MHWNDTNQLPFRLFWWESPDGSKVLTYFPTDYVHDNVNPIRISADFAESAQRNPGIDRDARPLRHRRPRRRPHPRHARPGRPLDPSPARRRPHHALRHRAILLHRRRKKPQPRLPHLELRLHRQGLHRPTASSTGEIGLPTWNDELYFEYHRGVFTTQAAAQTQHAHQRSSRPSTPKNSPPRMARTASPTPPTNSPKTGRRSPSTSSTTSPPAPASASSTKTPRTIRPKSSSSNNEISTNALKTLAAQINTEVTGDVPVLVFNPLAWSRTGITTVTVQMPSRRTQRHLHPRLARQRRPIADPLASDAQHQHLQRSARHAKDVPPLGYTVLHAVTGRASTFADRSQSQRHHPRERQPHASPSTPTPAASPASSTSKSNFESLANACGNQLQTFNDTPRNTTPGTSTPAPSTT